MPRHLDHAADAKRRESIFQRWRGVILRETRDRPSLSRVGNRVFNDPDVRSDSVLAGMLRGFVMEQEAGLTQSERYRQEDEQRQAQPTEAVTPDPAPEEAPPAPDAQAILDKLEHEFHHRVAHFDEAGARSVVLRIQTLQEEHPDRIGPETADHYAGQLKRFVNRRTAFKKHIVNLRERAVAAARAGDDQVAGRALRRLTTIHTARPPLLSEVDLRQTRRDMANASEENEHRQAGEALLAREREVATEIKHLTSTIHRFHKIARRVPHDSEEYRQAQAQYGRAAAEVRSHDDEWLAGLILELVDLLEEWDEPSPQARRRLDHFLSSVRSALSRLREEIRAIETELHEAKQNR